MYDKSKDREKLWCVHVGTVRRGGEYLSVCLFVYVSACVCICVRACVRVCMNAYMQYKDPDI